MTCPDANQLVRFLDGEDAHAIEDHVDRCVECRALITELARTLDVPPLAHGSAQEDEHVADAWELASGAELVARGTQVDRYVVLDAIGAGAMGVVYRAYDPELDRDVALKLVRVLGEAARHEHARARVLREAQAMARLAHPNVVAVHDASTFGASVFVAMELVEGVDLEAWLAAQPRAWRDVVRVFAAAGRGLAAAHAAGIVHRDFKPSNVLVGNDGRARVTDFGLAVSAGAAERTGRATDTASRLTEDGTLLGTPAYMSPEVRTGAAADARSDQYSFALSLREAITGERSASTAKLPRPVRASIARALADDPSARYPSIDALVAALDRAVRPRRMWPVVAAGLVAVAAVEGFIVATRGQAPSVTCAPPIDQLAGIWDVPRKAAMHDAFIASKHPLATETWARVERAFDRYTDTWAKQHVAACEATHVRHEQSAALLDARMICLRGELARFTAIAELYAKADRIVVSRAEPAEDLVDRLARCSDPIALRSGFALPADPALRLRADAATSELARVEVTSMRGKYGEAITGAQRVITEAHATGALRLEADATRSLGETRWRAGDIQAAIETLHSAVDIAKRADAPDLEAGALLVLVAVLGYEDARYAEALAVARLAESAIRATGDETRLAKLLGNRAAIHYAKGDYAAARADYQQALTRFERAFGPEDRRVGQTLMNLAMVTAEIGDGEALPTYARALAIQERALGPRHPEVALTLANRAIVLANAGQHADAMRDLERALAIRTEVLGPTHRDTIGTHYVMGEVAEERDDHATALAQFRAAFDGYAATLRADHPTLAKARAAIGIALAGLARWREAVPELEQALAIWNKAGLAGTEQANIKLELASALWETGARPRALTLAREARAGFEGHPDDQAKVDAWLRGRKGAP